MIMVVVVVVVVITTVMVNLNGVMDRNGDGTGAFRIGRNRFWLNHKTRRGKGNGVNETIQRGTGPSK